MNRRTLVTGGTRGIGAAIAQTLVEAGYEVLVTGTSADDGRAPRGCAYQGCDFSKPGSLEAFANDLATREVEILVNNAGINKVGPLDQYDLKDFAKVQQVNVTAPFVLCRAVIPGMRRRKFGRIVNIASIFSLVSKAGRLAYSTSKFGVFGLTRALALEVAADNVLVNCLSPGFVETEMTRRTLGEHGVKEIVPRIPLGRLAQPQEIARYVRFLVSEDNTYMTGQNIVVDGGFTCG